MCPSTKVYAFEPRQHLFERVLTNARLNPAGDKITAYPWALSDETGEVTVNLDRREYVLTCRRLDDVVPGRIDVVKIDVEGMEPRVIDGAMASIARWRPRIFAEAGEPAQYEALVACLARHGYRPTGRVFSWTPTYEFVPVARSAWEKFQGFATEVPLRTRRSVGRLVRHHPALWTMVRNVRKLRRPYRPSR
jgi:FkbM family methyltransferase